MACEQEEASRQGEEDLTPETGQQHLTPKPGEENLTPEPGHVERERMEAVFRLLLNAGEITPTGAYLIRQVLFPPTEDEP